MLTIRSTDKKTWMNVRVTMYGVRTDGTKTSKTGRYSATKDIVDAGSLTAIDLYDFQSETGGRWISTNMHPEGIAIAGTIDGRDCKGLIDLK